MLDIMIIGAGPAGMSAALNAHQRNKTFDIFGKPDSSWVMKAELVNNYLGMPNVSGMEMMKRFEEHILNAGIEIKRKKVFQIFHMGEHFSVNVDNEFVEAKAVILALGSPKVETFKGENMYIGNGLSYCATCDGMLYRGKEVFVYGEGEEGIKDANFLSEICKRVYYYSREKADNLASNIEVVSKRPTAISGEHFVEGVMMGDVKIDVEGLFIIRDAAPISSIITGLAMDGNFIKVDRNMRTNIKGLFACGDCTGKPLQIAKAVSEGLIAALSASEGGADN